MSFLQLLGDILLHAPHRESSGHIKQGQSITEFIDGGVLLG